MFVELTHTKSNEKMFIRADKVIVVRQKGEKTLVIVTGVGGMYVNEDATLIKDTVECIVSAMLANKYQGMKTE
jgi:hypothetical protein